MFSKQLAHSAENSFDFLLLAAHVPGTSPRGSDGENLASSSPLFKDIAMPGMAVNGLPIADANCGAPGLMVIVQ